MVSPDGPTRVLLTHTKKGSEGHPRFSPDGQFHGLTVPSSIEGRMVCMIAWYDEHMKP